MTDTIDKYLIERQKLIEAKAYDPEHEKDACGVGLVASLDGKPKREIVEMGIKALKNVWHRGAVDADGKTGDGAGIRVEVPQEFFREHVTRTETFFSALMPISTISRRGLPSSEATRPTPQASCSSMGS